MPKATRVVASWQYAVTKSAMRQLAQIRLQDPHHLSELRVRVLAAGKASKTPEALAKTSVSIKALWEDPEFRARVTAAQRAGNLKSEVKKQSFRCPKRRAKLSVKSTSLWNDPIWREKNIKAQREARARNMADPVWRETLSNRVSAWVTGLWKDPDYNGRWTKR